jgi:hypothetical protein
MKVTLDISAPLLREARRIAARDRTTLQTLVELGLRRVVAARKQKLKFRMRKASFKGQGMHPEAQSAGWDRLRELAYEGRGG